MIERRQLERKHLMFYSRVFDRKTGKFVGYLGDITVEGVMIISDEKIETDARYSFRMDLPEDLFPKALLNLEVESIWCQPDVDPNFYNTGFRLLDGSEEDQEIITRIIMEYGFKGERSYKPQ
jgi:hypothetical protein